MAPNLSQPRTRDSDQQAIAKLAGGSGYSTPGAVVTAITGSAPALSALGEGLKTFRVIDKGECMAVDLLNDGPRTLLESPAVGDIAVILFTVDDLEDVDYGFVLWGQDIAENNFSAYQKPGELADSLLLGTLPTSPSLYPPLPPLTGFSWNAARIICQSTNPVVAELWCDGARQDTSRIDSAPITWTALTPYAADVLFVTSGGLVQRVTTAGTTGASEPVWQEEEGSATTTDGSAEWTHVGYAPSTGCVHVWLLTNSASA